MRVLLLNPPPKDNILFVREGRCMNREATWENLWPPHTLMYISSLLKRDGHKVKLVDGMVECKSIDYLPNAIGDFNPELAIVNTATATIYGDIRSACYLKNNYNSKIALFGVHPTSTHYELLKKNNDIDFVIRREPEITAKELANFLEYDKSLNNLEGITYRENGEIKVNKDREFVDLNTLPFPDRSCVNQSNYTLPFSKKPFTLISTSRGCPFGCIYCAVHQYYGKKFRAREPKSVVDEIEEVVLKYKIFDFLFWADEALFQQKTMERISDEILNRGLKIRWFCNSRADTISFEILKKMKKAGCWLMSFGIESGSQKILDNINKNLKLEHIEEAVNITRKAGIETIGHFIFGLPGETKKTAKKTIKFAKKLALDYAQFYIATPYPGTKFFTYAKENNLIETYDYSKYEISNAVVRTKELSPEQLMKIRKKAYMSFYLNPSFILKRFFNIKTKKELKNLFLQGSNYLEEWGLMLEK